MRKLSWLVTFASMALSACVSVPNTRTCTAAGSVAQGAICAETLTGRTSEMDLDEFLDFLEPQEERPDPARPGQRLPARAGALCQSSEDWNKMKTALEQACRELGRRCSYEVEQQLKRLTIYGPLNPRR